MPIDLEMLLSSTSHTFFPYSPFNSSNYSDDSYGHRLSFPQNHCAPRSPFRHREFFHGKPQHGDYVSSNSYKSNDKAIYRQEQYKNKKKVSFADDRGYKLVEVCEIPGAPKWADDVITLLIGSTKRSVVKEKKWKVAFDNPPWTDDRLLNMLETNMVVLENISVKEKGTDDILTGTIKVKNLAFEKSVFARVTFDRWLSYIDVPCIYLKPEKKNPNPSVYDSFCFSSKILSVASRYEVIELCICYQCNGNEYWDNNNGINYRLIVEYVKSSAPDSHDHVPRPRNSQFRPKTPRCSDATVRNYKFLLDSFC